MNLTELTRLFAEGIQQTTWPEFIAVVFGIASVVFSRMENILVYPTGMLSTAIYIFLYLTHGLYADASVNFYYTVMSILGWISWSRKAEGQTLLSITGSDARDWRNALLFFAVCWVLLFGVLRNFTDSSVPQADAFTSAAAFTAMWLMNKKKVESWTWWILTDLASIPLNFYKHLVFTSFQYLVFLILAILGYFTWRKKSMHAPA